jgi:hydroxyacylglutathione hydrolase
MYFAQHYLDCLSQASYLIGDDATGRAVLVDPRRDIAEYLEDAAAHGLAIEGVINTHFHADFLAGHLEVARATGAWIGYGTAAQPDYEVRHLADGERIELGGPHGVALEIMHTPGHTPESISVLVYEHADDDVPYGVLTGDALFIGDVGRPDLLASVGVSAEQLGDMLYDSIQNKLMGLPDTVRVFPAHGAGSSCGKNLSTEKQSTIGEQRRLNYACQPMNQERFVALVTADQPSMPEYFGYDAVLNRLMHETSDSANAPTLTVSQASEAAGKGAVLLDARDAADHAVGHLRGSISVPLDGRFAETVGMLLQPDQDVVIIAPAGHEAEVVTRLARIGFDRVVGTCPTSSECSPRSTTRASVTRAGSRLRPWMRQSPTPPHGWRWSMSATPEKWRAGTSPQPGTCRWPNCAVDSRRCRMRRLLCSTARAAGAPAWQRATCGARDIPTSPTSSAATTRGQPALTT